MLTFMCGVDEIDRLDTIAKKAYKPESISERVALLLGPVRMHFAAVIMSRPDQGSCYAELL